MNFFRSQFVPGVGLGFQKHEVGVCGVAPTVEAVPHESGGHVVVVVVPLVFAIVVYFLLVDPHPLVARQHVTLEQKPGT